MTIENVELVGMIAELGEDTALAMLTRQGKAEAYRRAYQKKTKATEREILRAFKDGRLSFGGTRVDMTGV